MEAKSLGDLPLDNTIIELQEFADYVRDRYRRYLQEGEHLASHNLFNNITFNEGNFITGTHFEVIMTMEDYWKNLEEGLQPQGTQPNNVRYEDILKWVQIKPVLPDGRYGYIPNEYQLAHMITNKIKLVGTEPHKYLEMTLDEAIPLFKVRITEALKKDIQQEVYLKIQEGLFG